MFFGLGYVSELAERNIANEPVADAILYGYVIDEDSPNFLGRGDQIFAFKNRNDEVSISSNSYVTMEYEYSDSEHTVAKGIAVEAGVSAYYGAFSASASMKVSRSSSSNIKTVRVDSIVKATKYTVSSKRNFRNFPHEFLTASFKKAINTPLSYEDLENKIGIFYATKLNLGGKIRKSYTMQATAQDTESSVKAELSAKFGGGLMGGSAKASVGVTQRTSNKNSQMKVTWSAQGGDTTVWLGSDFSGTGANAINDLAHRWAKTINDENLYPSEFKLRPMWEMVKAVNTVRGEGFQKYLEEKWKTQAGMFHPKNFLQPEVQVNLLKNVNTLVIEQSSQWGDGAPQRALDGNTDGNYGHGSCTHTDRDTRHAQYWKVTLPQRAEFSKVVVYPRVNFGERIDQTRVYVDNYLCGMIKYNKASSYTVDCGKKQGSVLKIELRRYDYLTLCEVKAFGVFVEPELTNVLGDAKSLVLSQTNVGWEGTPQRAVDGNIEGNYNYGSCMHTDRSANNPKNVWKATLPRKATIKKVVVYVRTDCCKERINGVEVWVGNHRCGVLHDTGASVYTVDCGNAVGNNVQIVKNEYGYLSFCEVLALGTFEKAVVKEVNLLSDGNVRVSQRTTGWGGVAQRAVDGRTDGNYEHGSCTHTDRDSRWNDSRYRQWWKAVLPRTATVNRVVVYNRTDCCGDRIKGAKVFVGNHLCGTINSAATSSTVNCGNARGNEIRVELYAYNYLALCEVQAFGNYN